MPPVTPPHLQPSPGVSPSTLDSLERAHTDTQHAYSLLRAYQKCLDRTILEPGETDTECERQERYTNFLKNKINLCTRNYIKALDHERLIASGLAEQQLIEKDKRETH